MVVLTMILAQAATQPSAISVSADMSSVWYALGTTLAGLLVALGQAAKSNFKFQKNLMDAVAELKERDEKQQGELNLHKATIVGLRKQLKKVLATLARRDQENARERQLKHFYRGNLQAAAMTVDLYRAEHGRHADDKFDWEPSKEPADPVKAHEGA